MAAPAPGTGRRENAFTRHVGPLPMWGWLAIIASGILLWAWYEHSKGGASSGTGAATAAPEVIQTTPPEVNIYNPGGPGPHHHHNRHKPRTLPKGVNPGGLNDPGPPPRPHKRGRPKRLPTVHKRHARHPGTNKNVGPHKHKRKPKILNPGAG